MCKGDRERNIEYISKEGGKCYINGRIVRRKQYLKKSNYTIGKKSR